MAELPSTSGERPAEWQLVLASLKENLPEQAIRTWIEPLKVVSFQNDTLLLRAPSRFIFEWVEANYGVALKQAIGKAFGLNTKIEFSIAPLSGAAPRPAENPEQPLPEIPQAAIKPIDELVEVDENQDLDSRFSLAHFSCFGTAEMAVRAAEFVAENPGKPEFNPMVFSGGEGTGKTHLLHGIGLRMAERFPTWSCRLLNGEIFLSDYVNSLRESRIEAFIKELANTRLLLLDDVDFLGGKQRSQETLVLIIKRVIRNGGQVVISSSQPPSAVPQLYSRLSALLQEGLIVELPEYNPATREDVVRRFLNRHQIDLDDPSIDYLANNGGQNMHQLHSILMRIAAQISILRTRLTLEEVTYIANRLVPRGASLHNGQPLTRLAVPQIIEAVGEFYAVASASITGNGRKQKLVKARQTAIYLSRELTDDSLTSIGYHFSNLHHASVLYAIRKVEEKSRLEPRYKSELQKIRHRLSR